MVDVVCDNCKRVFKSYRCYEKRNRKHRFCSQKCSGEFVSFKNTPESWKGGTVSPSTGYRYIAYKGGAIKEHRLVVMRHLGRELGREEIVHHINGDKLDNRLENLQLMTNSEHQKLHRKSKKHAVCAACGEEKLIRARGLCANCYDRDMRAKMKAEGRPVKRVRRKSIAAE